MSSSSRVYIGRLSSRASEHDIERFFRGYGHLRDVVMKNGFGFVEFDTSRDADDAISDLNGKELAGERVQLELSRRRPDRGSGGGGGGFGGQPMRRDARYGPPAKTRHRLIVENLSSRISWQDLKDMMRSHGDVTYADAHKERRNEGILCFASRDDLKRTMDKMQGKDVNGRKLKLIDDSEKRAGGGSSRSRSRSPRRSRSRRSSRSRSRSSRRSHSRGSKSRSRSRSKGRGDAAAKKSRSRTRSASPKKKENGGAGDKDKSRSPSASPRGRSSASPNGRAAADEKSPVKEEGGRDRSRSASPA